MLKLQLCHKCRPTLPSDFYGEAFLEIGLRAITVDNGDSWVNCYGQQTANPLLSARTIHDVVIDVSGKLILDRDAAMRNVMAHQ